MIAADVKIEKEEHFVFHREAEEAQVRRRLLRFIGPPLKCFHPLFGYTRLVWHAARSRELPEPQVRDFFSQTLGMEGDLLEEVVRDVTKDDDTLLTFMRKVRRRARDGSCGA